MTRFAKMTLAAALFLGMAVSGCASEDIPPAPSAVSVQAPPQTGYTSRVPAELLRPSPYPGRVERLDYASFDYAGDGAPVTKTAFVYLPYGYGADGGARYDVLYLMHGLGGHAGQFFERMRLKNVFDNMIGTGLVRPLIIVSPTFYSGGSHADMDASVAELRQFHRDFRENLMPAVEGTWRTHAGTTADEDLKASRDHRAFGGFSLGSATTWEEFCHDAGYIRFFLPMSGSCLHYGAFGDFQTKRNVDHLEKAAAVKDLAARGFFIYQTTGTNDAGRGQTIRQAREMLARKDAFGPDRYVFYQKEGGRHDYMAVREYLYNALPLFFPGDR